MESGDRNQSDMTEIIQQLLNTILEHVLTEVEGIEGKGCASFVNEIVNDALRSAVMAVEEEKLTCFNEKNLAIHEKKIQKEMSYEGNIFVTDEDCIKEDDASRSIPTQSRLFAPSEGYSKSDYLGSRASLYASLIWRPDGLKMKQATGVRPSVRDMMVDYTLHASKGHEKKDIATSLKNETKMERFDSIKDDENMPNIHMCASASDVTSFTIHLENCTNRYTNLQKQSINSLRAECIEHFPVNKIADAKVLVKADLLKGKVFPKFSKVKKIKTKYGKVSIHFSDTLSKEEQERVVKEAEEMLKMAKQEELEDKKQQKEMRNKRGRSFGSRIGNFFGRLSCCKNNPDE